MRVLVVEDEVRLAATLQDLLELNGYTVDICHDGESGLDNALTAIYDVILLDVMLPKLDGFTVLRRLRTEHSTTPVLMLTARSDLPDRVQGLDCGADYYLTKPFDLDEVLVRVEAVLRRCGSSEAQRAPEILKAGKLAVDTESKTASVDGQELVLTAKEYGILELLMRYPHKVFSKANLFESIWNEEYACEDNTLNVHMSNLRNKLKAADPETEYIKTVWGMGYRMN